MKRGGWLAAAFALCAGCAGSVWAQDAAAAADADLPRADAPPQPERAVRDPDFGVVARHFGLERRVAMYQWYATARGYARGWSERPLDSAGFAPGHDNPPFPLQGRRWLVRKVTVDGRPLEASVLERLGQWREFRPSFNALPGNLSATFQPQGDGLGSAENPLAPQVGDLRIHWRELRLPPLQDRIVLREGYWQLREDALPAAVAAAPVAPAPAPARTPWWWVGGGALGLLLAAAIVRRRRGGRHAVDHVVVRRPARVAAAGPAGAHFAPSPRPPDRSR